LNLIAVFATVLGTNVLHCDEKISTSEGDQNKTLNAIDNL